MTISWHTIHYPTTLSLIEALPPAPKWAKSVTFHHTWKPTEATWRGARSMEALRRFYAGKGWKAGPHLFVTPDGIWGGTPLTIPGIHAGPCNVHAIGVEIVGDFDAAPWPATLRYRLHDLFVRLLHWLGTDETALRGHRECLNNKSCPGRAITPAAVRADILPLLFNQRFAIGVPMARLRAKPTTISARIGELPRGSIVPAHAVVGQTIEGVNQWARVQMPSGLRGYVFGALGAFSEV